MGQTIRNNIKKEEKKMKEKLMEMELFDIRDLLVEELNKIQFADFERVSRLYYLLEEKTKEYLEEVAKQNER